MWVWGVWGPKKEWECCWNLQTTRIGRLCYYSGPTTKIKIITACHHMQHVITSWCYHVIVFSSHHVNLQSCAISIEIVQKEFLARPVLRGVSVRVSSGVVRGGLRASWATRASAAFRWPDEKECCRNMNIKNMETHLESKFGHIITLDHKNIIDTTLEWSLNTLNRRLMNSVRSELARSGIFCYT